MDTNTLVLSVTALISALWGIGGQAALQRRTIGQELELAHAMEDPDLRAALIVHAEDRVAIYLARRRSATDNVRWLLLRSALMALGAVLFELGPGIDPHDPELVQVLASGLALVGMALLGFGFGAIIDEMWREVRATTTQARVKQARRRLSETTVANPPTSSRHVEP